MISLLKGLQAMNERQVADELTVAITRREANRKIN